MGESSAFQNPANERNPESGKRAPKSKRTTPVDSIQSTCDFSTIPPKESFGQEAVSAEIVRPYCGRDLDPTWSDRTKPVCFASAPRSTEFARLAPLVGAGRSLTTVDFGMLSFVSSGVDFGPQLFYTRSTERRFLRTGIPAILHCHRS